MPVGERKDPYRNFRFRVEIDGVAGAGFCEVIMPAASATVIEYREGGDPAVTRKLPGRIEYGNVVLKWGITDSLELYEWWQRLVQGQVERRNMSVILLDGEGNEASRWNFYSAWPVRYQPSPLEAVGNQVFIETLEIAHEGMSREG